MRLFLREDQTTAVLTQLREGQVDVVLMALPYELGDFEHMELFNDPFQFACAPDHPPATRPRVEVEDLAGEPLMLLAEGHCLREHALEFCRLRGRQSSAQLEAASLHTLVQMVAAGIGVTLLPQLAVEAGITDGTNIRLIPLAGPASRQIALVWRRTSLRADAFAAPGRALLEG